MTRRLDPWYISICIAPLAATIRVAVSISGFMGISGRVPSIRIVRSAGIVGWIVTGIATFISTAASAPTIATAAARWILHNLTGSLCRFALWIHKIDRIIRYVRVEIRVTTFKQDRIFA